MANYLGIPEIAQPTTPYEPDINFMLSVLQTKELQYERGKKAINKLYNTILNSPLTRLDNQERRNQYFKEIQRQMNDVANLDLSQEQNIQAAKSLFEPLYNDKFLMKDMAFTKSAYDAYQKGENMRYCLDPDKCGGKFWEGGLQYIQYKMKEFKDATPEEAMNMSAPSYVPMQNVAEKAYKLAKDMGVEIKIDNKQGQYIVTTKNGKNAIPILTSLFNSVFQSDPSIVSYFKVQSYLQRKNFVELNKHKYNGDEVLAEQEYINTVLPVLKKSFTQQKEDSEKENEEATTLINILSKDAEEKGLTKKEAKSYKEWIDELNKQKEISEKNKTQANENITKLSNLGQIKDNIKALASNTDDLYAYYLLNTQLSNAAINYAMSKFEYEIKPDQFELAKFQSQLIAQREAAKDARELERMRENWAYKFKYAEKFLSDEDDQSNNSNDNSYLFSLSESTNTTNNNLLNAKTKTKKEKEKNIFEDIEQSEAIKTVMPESSGAGTGEVASPYMINREQRQNIENKNINYKREILKKYIEQFYNKEYIDDEDPVNKVNSKRIEQITINLFGKDKRYNFNLNEIYNVSSERINRAYDVLKTRINDIISNKYNEQSWNPDFNNFSMNNFELVNSINIQDKIIERVNEIETENWENARKLFNSEIINKLKDKTYKDTYKFISPLMNPILNLGDLPSYIKYTIKTPKDFINYNMSFLNNVISKVKDGKMLSKEEMGFVYDKLGINTSILYNIFNMFDDKKLDPKIIDSGIKYLEETYGTDNKAIELITNYYKYAQPKNYINEERGATGYGMAPVEYKFNKDVIKKYKEEPDAQIPTDIIRKISGMNNMSDLLMSYSQTPENFNDELIETNDKERVIIENVLKSIKFTKNPNINVKTSFANANKDLTNIYLNFDIGTLNEIRETLSKSYPKDSQEYKNISSVIDKISQNGINVAIPTKEMPLSYQNSVNINPYEMAISLGIPIEFDYGKNIGKVKIYNDNGIIKMETTPIVFDIQTGDYTIGQPILENITDKNYDILLKKNHELMLSLSNINQRVYNEYKQSNKN